jgi:hypothetical protein
MPFASIFNALDCQTLLSAPIGAKGFFPGLSNPNVSETTQQGFQPTAEDSAYLMIAPTGLALGRSLAYEQTGGRQVGRQLRHGLHGSPIPTKLWDTDFTDFCQRATERMPVFTTMTGVPSNKQEEGGKGKKVGKIPYKDISYIPLQGRSPSLNPSSTRYRSRT